MSGGDGGDERDRATGGDLPPSEIDRMFDLLEAAIEADALTGDQVDRLLAILREAVDGATGLDPEMLAELLSVLERFLLDPEARGDVDIDSLLGLFEEAPGVSPSDRDTLTGMFDAVEQGLRDPAGVEPEDVDQFQSDIQRLVNDMADPARGPGGLFSQSERGGDTSGGVDPFRLAQFAAVVTQRASGNSVESGIRVGTRLAYAAANAGSPAELLTTTRAITLDELRRAGIDIGERRSGWLDTHREEVVEDRPVTRDALAERGAQLISQSAEVGRDESVHPAFGSIIQQLSTDEARILRVLAVDGPQGVVDIYDRQYLPPKKWRVARNLTMLGRDAGCRTQRRTPVYIRNLRRLGIVEISEDPIDELKRYEVIEAQSHVEQARTRAKRARTEYKRLQLTDLGVEFCELCFPFEVTVDGEGLQVRENAGAGR
ncbi:MAG: hypothetical protein J07HX64_02357 [halophilic archaeon J07HX64]|jgi:hypothetical protein|nr:MAG: hypothetical protein J07HX64_02357 [halophilic archaeon J07HX64]